MLSPDHFSTFHMFGFHKQAFSSLALLCLVGCLEKDVAPKNAIEPSAAETQTIAAQDDPPNKSSTLAAAPTDQERTNSTNTAAQQIQQAHLALKFEGNNLQIVGRALSPQEESRLNQLGTASELLEKAYSHLETKPFPSDPVNKTDGTADAAALIQQTVNRLRGESGSLQVVGRALTPKEQQRVASLQATIDTLQAAWDALQNNSEESPLAPALELPAAC